MGFAEPLPTSLPSEIEFFDSRPHIRTTVRVSDFIAKPGVTVEPARIRIKPYSLIAEPELAPKRGRIV